MITLICYRPAFGEPSMSSFCIKTMALLNLSGQKWNVEWADMPKASPTGKLPAIRVGQKVVPDSNLILSWLEGQGADLFPGLSRREKAQAHAFMRMLEEHLRYGVVYDRWADADGWAGVKNVIFKPVPFLLRGMVASKIRKQIVRGLHWNGIARYSEDQRRELLISDLKALEDQLEGGDWLFGTQATAADCSALGILSNIDNCPTPNFMRAYVKGSDVLQSYLARCRSQLLQPVSALTAVAA